MQSTLDYCRSVVEERTSFHISQERVEMNRYLKDLDLMYTDYIEDEDYDMYEFLTLADIEAED